MKLKATCFMMQSIVLLLVTCVACVGGVEGKQMEVPPPDDTATGVTSKPTAASGGLLDALSGGKNRPPEFANFRAQETKRNIYDDAGRLTGVVMGITLSPASDPDGDALTYDWQVSTGKILSVSEDGITVTWERPVEAGKAAKGTVTVTASDGRGGTATARIKYGSIFVEYHLSSE